MSGGQRSKIEFLIWPLGQDDRAALGIQHADRVVENPVEEFVFAVQVREMATRSE